MGGNNSTRRVSFESDENENITVVKGIRLSENVINRMREPAAPPKPHPPPATTSPSSPMANLTLSPLLQPVPPPFDPITSLPPPPPPPPALSEPVAPPSPSPPAPSATEAVVEPAPPPLQPLKEQVAASTIIDMVLPSPSPPAAANDAAAPAFEPVVAPPSAPVAVELEIEPTSLLSPPAPIETLTAAPCPSPAVVESVALLAPQLVPELSTPPLNQAVAPSPPVIEPFAPPNVIEPIAPPSLPEPIPSPLPDNIEPITASPIPETEPISSAPVSNPDTLLPPSLHLSGDTLSSQPAEPFAVPPLAEFFAPCEPVAPPSQPPVETVPLPAPEPVADLEPLAVPESAPVPPPVAPPADDEEALRKKITEELSKGLEQERSKAEQELQACSHIDVCSEELKEEKAHAAALAQAEAQSQVQDEVSKILSVERAVAQESLQHAVMRERITAEDERHRAQLFEMIHKAKQLEAREAELKKQDVFYREQVARLEERSAQFYKVTTENYHKAADQVNAKFKRYEVYAVCADLQGQILKCYRENTGKTLQCSNIAALYLQCVNNAKQNKLRTSG
ncbi:hypothetical protein LDENG_00260400 [Lucifuga dentata]|nr:hypothetical protein LDENG_00260400 [Lucifuga dentata]